MNENEQLLLEYIATDLEHAFPQLVAYYQDRLYAFALRLSNSAQDAEDIVQEALLGAYITLLHYPAERIQSLKVRPWLYKLTLNVFRNRQRGLHLLTSSLDLSTESTLDTLQDEEEERPDFLYESAERLQDVLDLLACLPEHYRIVVTCYYFEDLSYQAIASLLNQPIGTIKSRLHRGLQLLRQHVKSQPLSGRFSHEIR